jgi:hypothetical protein
MKRPPYILIAASLILLKGIWLLYVQAKYHLPGGSLGNKATLGVLLMVLSLGLYWKVKGWRWAAFALFVIMALGGIGILQKRTAMPLAEFLVLLPQPAIAAWLAYRLVADESIKAFIAKKTT